MISTPHCMQHASQHSYVDPKVRQRWCFHTTRTRDPTGPPNFMFEKQLFNGAPVSGQRACLHKGDGSFSQTFTQADSIQTFLVKTETFLHGAHMCHV